jgi:hypothetical protein
MEVYHFPHFGASVHVALFHDVQNAVSLRARLVKASTMPGEEGVAERAAVNFAFIDARLVRRMRCCKWNDLISYNLDNKPHAIGNRYTSGATDGGAGQSAHQVYPFGDSVGPESRKQCQYLFHMGLRYV